MLPNFYTKRSFHKYFRFYNMKSSELYFVFELACGRTLYRCDVKSGSPRNLSFYSKCELRCDSRTKPRKYLKNWKV